eukprot:6786636-Prymnesium_polylepis.1
MARSTRPASMTATSARTTRSPTVSRAAPPSPLTLTLTARHALHRGACVWQHEAAVSRRALLAVLGDWGEGFCFDTNTLHQGELGGGDGRDAIIFEFNAFEKSQTLDRELCAPCGGFWSLDANS